MGPLALMAKNAGMDVCGSDLQRGAIYDELVKAGIRVHIGEQDGEFLESELEGLDWFVHTSALPEGHPELVLARKTGVKCTKRDDFTAFLVGKLGLKMVAVAGTHGKTTTTAMIVWACLKLGLPVAYIVGTTLGFAPSGAYHPGDKYFVYEADEYDRNFLKYHPWLAVVTTVSYDHPDIYSSREDYEAAFSQFVGQSERVIVGDDGFGEFVGNDGEKIGRRMFRAEDFRLAGEVRRADAALAADAVYAIQFAEFMDQGMIVDYNFAEVSQILDEFPGVGRRFERLADGVYTDYAHHPEEIAATIEVAREQAELEGRKGVVVVYQPHQNTRQHEVRDGYREAFLGAEKVFWLPTYLTRENSELPILTAEELILGLLNSQDAEAVELTDELFERILEWRDGGYLVVLMTAGPADGWLREKLQSVRK